MGAEADGVLAEHFRNLRLKMNQSLVTVEAIRERKTLYVNNLDPARSVLASTFRSLAVMAAPRSFPMR